MPTTEGTQAFAIRFSSASGIVFAVPYVWTVTGPEPLHISGVGFRAATLGQPYSGGFFSGGGVAPYRWSVSAGALPPGLRMNSTTSEVSGTPTARGVFSFTARLTDNDGKTLDTPVTIAVS